MSRFVFDPTKVNHEETNSNTAIGISQEQAEDINNRINDIVEKSDKPSEIFVNMYAEFNKDELCAIASQMLVDKVKLNSLLDTVLEDLSAR
jgi:hypothetical protein